MTSQNDTGCPAPADDPGEQAGQAATPAPARPRPPALPEQSREDTDAGWGEYAGRDTDRLDRDRPPHWDDF